MTADTTNNIPATRTPAGLQNSRELFIRRSGLGLACAVIYAALVGSVALILGRGGWTLIDALMLLCFSVAAPWSVLGFVNALIGAWLCWRPSRELLFDPARSAPDAVRIPTVAMVMTIRNEDPLRAFLRLRTVKESLDASGGAESISYFILSDTSDEGTAADEEAAFSEWMACETSGPPRLFYRRRPVNTGYKAGNLADFCKTHGGRFDYFVPLDADSLMTAQTVQGMIGVMEAFPKIGILQSLVVGLPSSSAFARVFQFGMRHGMRSYTLGCTWWSGDCSQFWGHNAIVRLKPFLRHCRLNDLPGGPPWGGPVLSHDQIEAALMRRAGYEVRVIASESGSYEENPPTILEFMRRDRRWCRVICNIRPCFPPRA